MTATVLNTWRPWHQRLFDRVRGLCSRAARATRRHASLEGLDARALRDIGIDGSSEVVSIPAEFARVEKTRSRILAGQRHAA